MNLKFNWNLIRAKLKQNKKKLILTAYLFISIAFAVHYICGKPKIAVKWNPPLRLSEKGAALVTRSGTIIENVPKLESNLPANCLKEYTIKFNLYNNHPFFFMLNFCNSYSFVLDLHNLSSGIYFSENQVRQLISGIKYNHSNLIKKYEIILKCNLVERTIETRINNGPSTKIFLAVDNRELKFSISLLTDETIFLKNFEIYDTSKGKYLFKENYAAVTLNLFSYLKNNLKTVYWLFFFMGIITLFLLFTSAKNKLFRCLLIFTTLVLIESFLRMTANYSPYLNLNLLFKNPMWDVESYTNLLENNRVKKTAAAYPVQPKKKSLKIICLGSSSTAGSYSISKRNLYPALLEKNIKLKNKNAEIINAGIGGYEAFRISIYLNDVLVKLNPDIVTVYLGDNDMHEGLISTPLILYLQYGKMKSLLKNHSDWITNQKLLFIALDFRNPTKEVVYLYSYLCKSYLFMSINNLRRKLFNALYQKIDAKQKALQKSSLDVSEESLRSIAKTCSEQGIKLIFIPEINSPEYSSWIFFRQIMEEISKKDDNVYYLDLRKTFKNNSRYLLFQDKIHPTEYGHRIIAEEIYNKLIKEKLI